MSDLEYEISNGVGTIRLNRPTKKNSFTMAMIDEWATIYRDARTDDSVRVLVLTGSGDSFCAGADMGVLDASVARPLDRKNILTEHIHQIAYALEDLDKPVIASVNGVAVGAGMDMALMCDIRLAARSAKFSEGYVRLGIVPGDGGCYYLPRLIGPARALELLLTGEFVDADEAERIGIVNHVYEDDKLDDETNSLAQRLAEGPPIAIRMIKRALYQSARSDLRTSLDLISSHMGIVQSTADTTEAYAAFQERRKPNYQGN